MFSKSYAISLITMCSVIALFSCSSTKQELAIESVADYYPMVTGKYIVYRLDSLVFTQSGSQVETHKYQVKHIIQSEIMDATGKKSFIIHRLIRNESGTSPWLENGNYIVTPIDNRVDVIENNLRIIKLINPINTSDTWKGNRYLVGDNPFKDLYDFEVGKNINTWKFKYTGAITDETIEGREYKNLCTIEQSNSILNLPPQPGVNAYGAMEVGIEKYAKGLGLVYRKYHIYDYQPGHSDNAYQPTYTGFGITMWMIDHN